jgi:hypothetical protein
MPDAALHPTLAAAQNLAAACSWPRAFDLPTQGNPRVREGLTEGAFDDAVQYPACSAHDEMVLFIHGNHHCFG